MKSCKKKRSTKPKNTVCVMNGASTDILFSLSSYYVVSIDPGLYNIGFRIEHRQIINKWLTVNTICMHRLCLNDDKYQGQLCTVFDQLDEFLDQYSQYYSQTALYLIESQEVMGAYWVVRVAQHISSYYRTVSKSYPGAVVAEISPRAKSKYLGGGKMTRAQLVLWQDSKGLQLLQDRNDMVGITAYHQIRGGGYKTDDAMVTVLQSEAFHIYLRLPSTMNQVKIL